MLRRRRVAQASTFVSANSIPAEGAPSFRASCERVGSTDLSSPKLMILPAYNSGFPPSVSRGGPVLLNWTEIALRRGEILYSKYAKETPEKLQ